MKTFLIGDTHFWHSNIINFKTADGSPLRPYSSVEEMNEALIKNWNSVVGAGDKVYHLGDVAFKNSHSVSSIFPRLNGEKVLIKGNHDILKPSLYLQFFKDIRAYHQLDKILLAHIPVHPDSMSRWRGQIHGHVHNNSLKDKRFYNVSVEAINYTPIEFGVIREHYEKLDRR